MPSDNSLHLVSFPERRIAALAAAFFAGLDDLKSDADDKPIVVAAGESILRWLIVPTVSRLVNQAFHWNLKSMRTLEVLDALANGGADLGVVREDAATIEHVSKTVGTIDYVLAFPRNLLPGQTAAGIYTATRLPFALLAGDGKLARQILDLAEKFHLRLDTCMELESFSLLVEAVKTRNVGAVIPRKAIGELSEADFAIIEDDQLALPPRPLILIAHEKTHLLRPRIRKAFEEFSRILPASPN